jgi:hypothetical protein
MTFDTTPLAIARIDRVTLWTDQLERLREFYQHGLGAPAAPVYVEPAEGGRRASVQRGPATGVSRAAHAPGECPGAAGPSGASGRA